MLCARPDASAGTETGSSTAVAPAARRPNPWPIRVSTSRVGGNETKRPLVEAAALASVNQPATSTTTSATLYRCRSMVPSAPTGTTTVFGRMSKLPPVLRLAVPGHAAPPAVAVRKPPPGSGPDRAVTTSATELTPELGRPPRPRTGTSTRGYGDVARRVYKLVAVGASRVSANR